MQVEKFTFFGSFYEAMKMLPENQRSEFVMGILEYAFEGIEPSFEGGLAAMFALAKPNIDSSVKGVRNGGKGGRPAGGKTQQETPHENPPAKPPTETNKNRNRDRDRDRDRKEEGIFPLEEKSLSSEASGDAAMAGATPPAAPRCPMCDTDLEHTGINGSEWWCPHCRDSFADGKVRR